MLICWGTSVGVAVSMVMVCHMKTAGEREREKEGGRKKRERRIDHYNLNSFPLDNLPLK